MRWMTTVLALTVLAMALEPTRAEARGGNYRGPGGAVPPGLREPMDPAPPPPPPPGSPALVAPTTPTPPPPASMPRSRVPSRARAGVMGFEAWPFWFHYNKEVLEPRTEAAKAFARNFGVLEKKICTAILGAIDPKGGNHPSIDGAAYIALGKIAWKPEHVALLRAALAKPAPQTVLESAALALGLLRRTALKQQFDAALLDEVRSDLFGVLEDDTKQMRLRGFAAIALGLLGDQPARSALHAQGTTARLDIFTKKGHAHPNLFVAGMQALSLQSPESITDSQRALLRTLWRDGVFAGRDLRTYERVQIAVALGRVGQAEDVDLLVGVMADSAIRDLNLGRSALAALGTLGARLDTEARKRIADAVVERLEADDKEERKPAAKRRLMDPTQRNLALMALARSAAAELEETEPSQALIVSIGRTLQKYAAPTAKPPSAYAALGLGWMGRVVGASPSAGVAAWHEKTRKLLARGLAHKPLAPRDRGAYAIALGWIDADGARPLLVKYLTDKRNAVELRGACARALGSQRDAGDGVDGLLALALAERRSESMRMDCAAALGLLAESGARPLLVTELKDAKSMAVKGTVARALANLGDEAAVDALIAYVRDPAASALTRSVACAALGMIGDPEPRPSLARVTAHMNWRAMGDLLNEISSIL